MSHIFISYSRKDIEIAERIVIALADNKLDTWIDWKSIPKGEDWEMEIYHGIEEADVFLFLISFDSVRSEMCNKEILHAVKNGKRILPIFISKGKDNEVYS
ncbi:MAG TPA: toll/interleukin-1 receptor domain-containing protein [Anaerolineales bacterium]|nr:toll/interleukin-1 receptor domain-containing protein [Anaerolineales bacterium]